MLLMGIEFQDGIFSIFKEVALPFTHDDLCPTKQNMNPGQASNLMKIYKQRNYPNTQHGKLDKD